MRPGQAERRTHDYKRHGTTSLFAALDVEDRQGHRPRLHRRHRSHRVPQVPGSHRRGGAGRPRGPSHPGQLRDPQDAADPDAGWPSARASTCTSRPTYGSWLNLVERWFARADDQTDSPGRPSQCRVNWKRAILRVHRRAQRRAQAVRVDEECRRDPREHRAASPSGRRGTTHDDLLSESLLQDTRRPTAAAIWSFGNVFLDLIASAHFESSADIATVCFGSARTIANTKWSRFTSEPYGRQSEKSARERPEAKCTLTLLSGSEARFAALVRSSACALILGKYLLNTPLLKHR